MFDLSSARAMPRPLAAEKTVPALQQTSEFAAALRLIGQAPMVVDAMQDMLVMRRKLWRRLNVAMVTRAELHKPARLLEILQEEGLRRTPVILSPESPQPELATLGAIPLMTPAHVGKLDIHLDRGARRAQLKQKWRNRLSHAEGQALRITRQNMPITTDHWLLAADAAQQRARGYKGWPTALTLAYAQANKGRAKLFEAHEGRNSVAAMLVLTHGTGETESATYHIAHSTERGKELSAHNLLMWTAMDWLASKGIQELDLGVINTDHASGLARFKLGTGARLHKLGGTWVYWPPLGRRLAPIASFDLAAMSR